MKKLAFALCLIVLAGCRSGGPKPAVQFPPIKAEPPLHGKVTATIAVLNKDRTVAVNQPMLIDLRLTNVSREDAIVYNELELGWLVIVEFINTEGKRSWTPADLGNRSRSGKYHYVCLPPGGFIGRQYALYPQDPRLSLTPGSYSVRVVYHNTYEPCFASPFISDEDVKTMGVKSVVPLLTGIIVSNVETLQVVE